MGHGNRLAEQQGNEFGRVRSTTPSADVFRNGLIILMSDSRETIAAMAEPMRRRPVTVRRMRKLERRGGIVAVQPIQTSGRFSRAAPAVLKGMKKAVPADPMTLG
jgi:hypothetical protein